MDAIYTRQSKEKIDSILIESQIDFCRYETRGRKYKTYTDKGFSGKNTNRPAVEEMLKDIEKGIIKRVIVYKLDRISRSILDFSNMMEVFQKYNVDFISSTEKFDTSTPIGRAMLNICIVFAQLERETIQKRVIDTYYSRSKKGFYMGVKVPYGFSLKETVIDGIRTSKYEPIEEEIEQIKMMFSIYSQPTKSLGDILRYFNEHGIKNPRGYVWRTAGIGNLLRNPAYVKADSKIYDFYKLQGANIINNESDFTGKNACYLYKGESNNKDRQSLKNKNLVLAPHEGIISSTEWLKCRMKCMDNRCISTAHKTKNTWLSGKIKCGNCGFAIVIKKVSRRRKPTIRYFVCNNRASKGDCVGCGTVIADEIENFIFEEIKNKLENFKVLMKTSKNIANPKINEYKIKLSQINKEIDTLLEKVSEANRTLMKYINDRVEKLDEERTEISEKLTGLLREDTNTDIRVITDYISHWEEINLEDKMTVVDSLIKVIHVADGKIDITWKV